MLNKVKLIGKFISPKKQEERVNPNIPGKAFFYFSLQTITPASSVTYIRCVVTQPEKIERIESELANEQMIKVEGKLKNDRLSRQILVKVAEWTKVDSADNQDEDALWSDEVKLVGKIVDIKNHDEEEYKKEGEDTKNRVLSFKLLVPETATSGVEGDSNNIYFCRINGHSPSVELAKGDLAVVWGFLQTKKLVDESTNNVERISSVICLDISVIENLGLTQDFYPNIKNFSVPTKKIDFTKPKYER